jgi:hypothetical protein
MKLCDSNNHFSEEEEMSAPSNHTELSVFASILLRMLKDKPDDWSRSVVLGGEDSDLDELSVLVFAIELLKSGYPICLDGELVNGLEGFVSEGFSIKLAANAEELELTQQVVDHQIASMGEVKAGLARAREKIVAGSQSDESPRLPSSEEVAS